MNALRKFGNTPSGDQETLANFPSQPVLWIINTALLCALIAVQCLISLPAAAESQQYMIDDDHINAPYRSSSMLPNAVTTLYETTLPNFFGPKNNSDPSISISIQQLDDSKDSALMDDERQKSLRPFTGDPLDRKALVIEVPLD
ncbi:hypothetical protein ACFOEK_15935 [Litoribrevibacter euphylliae]|uniref:Uncharacterized protein n=1 Tax=Litoribrevibacter euphylliae TaxID=1834034 RepID=A0ABV7HIK8_9GAMM